MALNFKEIKEKYKLLNLDVNYVIFVVWLISALYEWDNENSFESISSFFKKDEKENI